MVLEGEVEVILVNSRVEPEEGFGDGALGGELVAGNGAHGQF